MNIADMDRLKKYTEELNVMLLTLEDDTETIELLEREFKKNGFENPQFFTKPKAALEAIAQGRPSIIIVDHNLGGGEMTGAQFVTEARRLNKDCYCIGYSGITDPKLLVDFFNSGLNKYVDKEQRPYFEKLIIFIREALQFIKSEFDWMRHLANEINDLKSIRNANSAGTT